jgi:hypothetical protein
MAMAGYKGDAFNLIKKDDDHTQNEFFWIPWLLPHVGGLLGAIVYYFCIETSDSSSETDSSSNQTFITRPSDSYIAEHMNSNVSGARTVPSDGSSSPNFLVHMSA